MQKLRVPQAEINGEQEKFVPYNRLSKFKNQSFFPIYSLPSDRDFERLLYFLFTNNIEQITSRYSTKYEEVWLMQGSKGKGRDVALKSQGNDIGLVQCKFYKDKLNRGQVGKEILKFTLYVVQNQELIQVIDTKFHYYLASVLGINDPAKEFIEDIKYNHLNELDGEIKEWCESLIKDKNYNFSELHFPDIKDQIYEVLKKVDVYSIDQEYISDLIKNDSDTRDKFFILDTVIDRATFESLLQEREKKHLELLSNLSELEKALSDKDNGLFTRFIQIRNYVLTLINEYSTNFIVFAKHRKVHTLQLPIILSALSNIGTQLNAEEIFILLLASYLSDIGVCQSYNEIIGVHPELQDDEAIRNSHHLISARFIRESGTEVLGIENKYIESVALLVEATGDVLLHPKDRSRFKSDYTIGSWSTNKINLSYLGILLWIADLSDLENINAEVLLHVYKRYPNYGVSVSRWNEIDLKWKHETKDERIIFETEKKIEDQLIYLSLNNSIEHLKSVLDVASSILIKENQKLSIKFIDNNLISGFKRKIGITVDSPTILSSLLGKKLYPKEIDAVRELVQNAMDACFLMEKLNPKHQSRIDILFENNSLVVADNGVGMTEEIISLYFAKIGRSYHVENENNRAIGQFGIGVFSYFMLNTSFIVETKHKKDSAMKFKVDEKAPDLFYFYDECYLEQGTRICFEQLTYDLSEFELEEYLKLTFRWSEIPIYFNGTKINVREQIDFVNTEELINKFIKIEHRDGFQNSYKFVFLKVDDENIDGWLGGIVPLGNHFEDIRRRCSQSLLVYNKGVFVQNRTSFIGEINIKKGIQLKLNRNEFEHNSDIQEITDLLEFQMYVRMFAESCSIDQNSNISFNVLPVWLTFFYLFNYAGGSKFNKHLHQAEGILFPFVFESGNFLMLSLAAIINTQRSVEIGVSRFDFPNDGIEKSKATSNCFIPVISIYTDYTYINYFKEKGYSFKIINHTICSNFLFYKRGHTDDFSFSLTEEGGQYEFIQFNDNLFCTSYSHKTYFNFNHSICQHYLSIRDNKTKKNTTLKFKGFFNDVHSVIMNAFSSLTRSEKYQNANVLGLNKRISEINEIEGTNLSFGKEDFPIWMQSYII